MTEPAITVTLTDTEFTVGELQEFLDTVRAVDGMPCDALISVKMPNVSAISSMGTVEYELSASTAYRGKQ